VPKFINKQNT
jgi:hypothetical protein